MNIIDIILKNVTHLVVILDETDFSFSLLQKFYVGEAFVYSASLKCKVKQSRYRPGQAQRVLRKLRFPDFVTTAQDGGKVISLTHRPPLPPGNTTGTHFC